MDYVLALARLTLTNPRAAARTLLDAPFPRELHWTLFLIVICLGGAVFAAADILVPQEDQPEISGLMAAAMVGASVLIWTGIMLLAGRLFGSRADAPDAMLLVLWLGLLSVAVQAIVVLVEAVLPGLGAVLGLVYFLLSIWLLSAFAAELHGLDGALRGFLAIAGAALAILFLLAVLRAVLIAQMG